MASITRRLQTLEDHSREQAMAEIRRAWDRLSDEEMALVVAPFHFGRERCEAMLGLSSPGEGRS